jgi:DNA-binding transcriptional LysR family regulator
LEFIVAPRFSASTDERLCYEPLFDDKFSVVSAAQNPVARRRGIRLDDLLTEAWVLPPINSALGSMVAQAFRARGLEFPSKMSTAPFEGRISLLTTGRFVTIVAASVLIFPAKRKYLKVLTVGLPIPDVPIEIVTLKNRAISPVVRLFVETARELAGTSARQQR